VSLRAVAEVVAAGALGCVVGWGVGTGDPSATPVAAVPSPSPALTAPARSAPAPPARPAPEPTTIRAQPPTIAPGPEAARLRTRILRLQAEASRLRDLAAERRRFADDPLAAFPRFDDERILPHHRPEVFERRMEAARAWLADADLSRETRIADVDCSAVPCLVSVDVAFGPDDPFEAVHEDDAYVNALNEGLGRASGYGRSATHCCSVVGDRWVRRMHWWLPLPSGRFQTFEERVREAAWGRIRAADERDRGVAP